MCYPVGAYRWPAVLAVTTLLAALARQSVPMAMPLVPVVTPHAFAEVVVRPPRQGYPAFQRSAPAPAFVVACTAMQPANPWRTRQLAHLLRLRYPWTRCAFLQPPSTSTLWRLPSSCLRATSVVQPYAS